MEEIEQEHEKWNKEKEEETNRGNYSSRKMDKQWF